MQAGRNLAGQPAPSRSGQGTTAGANRSPPGPLSALRPPAPHSRSFEKIRSPDHLLMDQGSGGECSGASTGSGQAP